MIKTTKKELMDAAILIRSACLRLGSKCDGCPFDTSVVCMFEGTHPGDWNNDIKTEEVTFIDE